MSRAPTALLPALLAGIFAPGVFDAAVAAQERELIEFERRELAADYYSEGVAVGDLDRDGDADVVYGPLWFEGPELRRRHQLAPARPQDRNGYADRFFAWVVDLDGDGWNDVVEVGFPGTTAHAYRNPGPEGRDAPWPRHAILDRVANESPHFQDLDGDGRPELVCTRGGRFGYAAFDPREPFAPWTFHRVSPRRAPLRFGHGLGVGDVDGDGRKDLLTKDGWYRQPASLAGDPIWEFHAVPFARVGGAEMHVADVDGDGDGDVITSLDAHGYGLSWFEQVRRDGAIAFVEHRILGSRPEHNRYGVVFSELHSVAVADLDGDGLQDVVTGKTYWSHHRKSPGWNDGAVVYWLRLVRDGKGGVDWVPHLVDAEAGIGRQVTVADVDGDGLLDVVTGGMKGAHVMFQRRRRVDEATWRKAQPKPGVGAPRAASGRIPDWPPPGWPRGVLPTGADGRPLNLDFEKGTLEDWVAEGEAFVGQPVRGDTVSRRRGDMRSDHTGSYWIGGFEERGDRPEGTLTSRPFRVTHPFASFLVGGGPWKSTRVEILDARTGKVLFSVSGAERENLRPVVLDMRPHAGKTIRIRLVDEHDGHWGHVNFDDFRFHARRPRFPIPLHRPKTPAEPDRYRYAGLSPQEAAAAMTVPEGFTVTLAAGEPDVRQPIAMALDHRGRVWIAEAYSYPIKRPAGQGKDRILIFEDRDGDGKFDERKVFLEGLDLVSGLEVGCGGVWIGQAPYLVFVPDRDGDDVPDGEPEILLDGWGYGDTHETLNSFAWGPDGWLYGCHGVFTHSRVGPPGAGRRDRVPLNAAVWRYHPTRREFEVVMHGASNQWGLDWDDRGQAFITACVIPHLYHVIPGGRYQRQAGRHFDAFVFDDIKTIADHVHWVGVQPHAGNGRSAAAGGGHAHCGAMIYLGGKWPERYRTCIFMNNIHGARINVDRLEPRGSGYVGRHEPDFLLANDSWSQILDLRYGPDGDVWMIDWYDANQCHRTDPAAHDRSNGRIFKVSYMGAGSDGRHRAREPVDLAREPDARLVEFQAHENDWFVRHARRVLQERAARGALEPTTRAALRRLLDQAKLERVRLRALWALHVTGGLSAELVGRLLEDPMPAVRGWTVRLACERGAPPPAILRRFAEMARTEDAAPVRLELAAALQRLPVENRGAIAAALAMRGEDREDHNIPLMLWYGIAPLVRARPAAALALARRTPIEKLARFVARWAAMRDDTLDAALGALLEVEGERRRVLLAEVARGLRRRAGVSMPPSWPRVSEVLLASEDPRIVRDAQALAMRFGDRRMFGALRRRLADRRAPLEERRHALRVLVEGRDAQTGPVLRGLLDDPDLRVEAIRAMANFADPAMADALLTRYPGLDPAARRQAVATLASRPAWAVALLDAVGAGRVPSQDLTAYVVRQLQRFGDPEIDRRIERVWGRLRRSSAAKEAELRRYRRLLTPQRLARADLRRGRSLYDRTCGACHRLFGAGGTIGPDLTGSNRKDVDYVLENVLDPSAIVGKDYQMTALETEDGRLLTGILAGETETTVTLRTQTEEVVVPRAEIRESTTSPYSMMPEGQFQALADDEVVDLVAYLASSAQVPRPGEPPRVDPATGRAWGAIEGESMEVAAVVGGVAGPQRLGEAWSGGSHLWWRSALRESRLDLVLDAPQDGRYRLWVVLTRATDYGVVRLSLDGRALGEPVDLLEKRVEPDRPRAFGPLHLRAGEHVLGLEMVDGKGPAERTFGAGLDYVVLEPVR